MLLGQSVLAPTGSGATYFGPWVPRQGNGFLATIQVLFASAGFSVVVEVQTKNEEDNDSVSSIVSLGTMTATATGLTQAKFTGCKELMRYKYSVTGTGSLQWLHMRMNPPIWQPN